MDDFQELKGKSEWNIPTPTQRLQRYVARVSSLEVDFNQPARMYFRSGMEVVRMADMYLKEGSTLDAYLLYMRFMTLFIDKIREHPGWSSVPASDRKLSMRKVSEVMPRTEKLKEQLLEQFEKEYRQRLKEEEMKQQKRKAEEEELRRKQEQQQKWQAQQEEVLRNKQTPVERRSHVVTGPMLPIDSIVYPEPDKRPSNIELKNEPSAPWFEEDSIYYPYSSDFSGIKPDGTQLENRGNRLPAVDRTTKPASLLSPSTQSRLGLRNVVVPSLLVERFLTLAHSTTVRNIETCGILAGRLDQNQLVITHLVVPKQHASPDSCTTENEEEVFNYQDKHDLITLGWIHTHPSQTAFLSSVDLHTHCSYQLMMPEAIAIVCAPRYKDNSIFSLTPHYGLNFIAKCTKTGFHPHPAEPPLFMIAEHARLESQLPVEVVDLRR